MLGTLSGLVQTTQAKPPFAFASARYAPEFLTASLGPAGCHAVYAVTDEGRVIGRLLWGGFDDGEVWWVGVDKDRRREGIATALWRLAELKALHCGWTRPEHSDTRMPDGEAWIASL
ncbi:GNAT family N-acetyltransferase [Streptomyces kaniharaensis]|uniref:GNAT family N-acetyltransferase n=1 Tax=Streptomyces kaniharaensis TaxID=212423 RepID=A0A6N7L569_9ACTN|nr:GNAT family N-acetyltransferase [Streptomyces kaniharaensis]MQS17484.1 GNAT family N-acetyltransferase [Streptomyces kaniharaensis]